MSTKVEFTYAGGRTRAMPLAHAKILFKLGRGEYLTRDIQAVALQEPLQLPTMPPGASPGQRVANLSELTPTLSTNHPKSVDALDSMDRAALLARAAELGLRVAPNARDDTLRTRIRGAQA